MKLIQLQRLYLFYENMQPEKNSDKNDGQMKKLDERKNCVKSFFIFHEKKFFHVCTYSRSIVHLCNPSSIISRPTTKKWGKILINILGKHNSNKIMPKKVFMDKKFYSFF